jgi:hypothetical protein
MSAAGLSVAVIGIDAWRALSCSVGEIAAVFDRSFYIRLGERFICGGAETIGRGPLNFLLRNERSVDWSGRLVPGQGVVVRRNRLLIDGYASVKLAGAAIWEPPPPPVWTSESLREGLATLDKLLEAFPPPADGLGLFAMREAQRVTRIARAADPPMRALRNWLATESCTEPTVEGLLGMGPGLTPSGDDFLSGMLCVLRRTDRFGCARILWSVIDPRLSLCTHSISASHLRCAAEGRLSATQVELLDAILTCDRALLRMGIERISAESHCSSWDGLAGMVTALRSLCGRM